MEIRNYILESYTTVHPFAGINSIEKDLVKKGYMVVIDDEEKFQGILTVYDLIKKPHKIVIDCLTEKEPVSADETILTVLCKFNKNQCAALPVFHENKFIGIVEKHQLIDGLKTKISELYNKTLTAKNLKESFLNNLSHEIRTPLNGLLGFLGLISGLDSDNIKSERVELYKTIINKSAERFLLIMNDLIDLAMINSGEEITIEREDVHIERIFSDLKKNFEVSEPMSNRKVSVHYENPDSSFVFFSDRKKIRHILYHLIDNAIKFSDDNKVIFGYKTEAPDIVFYVTNNGTQIAEGQRGKIFDAFEKQATHNNGLVSGLGIGLTLVKSLAELLGGKIDFVTNETQTTFFCTIPLLINTAGISL